VPYEQFVDDDAFVVPSRERGSTEAGRRNDDEF
jgi:hypothetical protein